MIIYDENGMMNWQSFYEAHKHLPLNKILDEYKRYINLCNEVIAQKNAMLAERRTSKTVVPPGEELETFGEKDTLPMIYNTPPGSAPGGDSGCPTITIKPLSLVDGTIGDPYPNTYMTASGGVEPYLWTTSSGFPPGLTLDENTGLLSGTPV